MLVSASTVPPGEEGKIEVEFDTSNRSGLSRKSVTVDCNDPGNRRIKLFVQATIDLQLEASPKRLWFGRITRHTNPVTITTSLDGSLGKTVIIKDILVEKSAPQGVFGWNLRDDRNQGGKLHLEVTLDPSGLIPGKFNYIMTIQTDLIDTPKVIVNLSGEISGSLSSTPSHMLFGNYELGVPMMETVEILSSENKPFAITSIESSDPELSFEFTSGVIATTHRILVHFHPSENRPRFETQVRISTTLETDSQMLLDVHGFQKRIPKKMTPREVY